MTQYIELRGIPEIRVSRDEDGEVTLTIRAEGGSVLIRAGNTDTAAGRLFRQLQGAGHAAFMIEEDWDDGTDDGTDGGDQAESPLAAYEAHCAALAAKLAAYERRYARRGP